MMFHRLASKTISTLRPAARGIHATAASNAKVAVLGAAGGIGQPLSLLCKLSPEVDQLSCYDIVGTPGVAADLSHIPSNSSTLGRLPSPVKWPMGVNDGLKDALEGAE